jgi:phosphoglycolate phosphatase-like HAD superfamily hydrolase
VDWGIGAFGSDEEDRTKLVPVAMRRAERVHGLHFESDEVWVMGDTPRDLECALAAGVRCALVGTGRYGVDRLAELGADATLEDLTDTDAVASIVLR